jgi:dTDP-4-dehydrorhamnose 3,5-epimerase
MRIEATALPGVLRLASDELGDARGSFARIFCERELEAAGVRFPVRQVNISRNARRGTLRGLHYQAAPHPEPKIVRCLKGAVWDVAVDLRPDSPFYRRWVGEELSAGNLRALYIPPGFAHGFITLSDASEILYLMGEFYEPALQRGIRWNDPALAIDWPVAPSVIAGRDAAYPDIT